MGDIKFRVLTYTTPRISPKQNKGMKRCKLKCAIAKTADVNSKAAFIGMCFVNDGRKKPLNMACSKPSKVRQPQLSFVGMSMNSASALRSFFG